MQFDTRSRSDFQVQGVEKMDEFPAYLEMVQEKYRQATYDEYGDDMTLLKFMSFDVQLIDTLAFADRCVVKLDGQFQIARSGVQLSKAIAAAACKVGYLPLEGSVAYVALQKHKLQKGSPEVLKAPDLDAVLGGKAMISLSRKVESLSCGDDTVQRMPVGMVRKIEKLYGTTPSIGMPASASVESSGASAVGKVTGQWPHYVVRAAEDGTGGLLKLGIPGTIDGCCYSDGMCYKQLFKDDAVELGPWPQLDQVLAVSTSNLATDISLFDWDVVRVGDGILHLKQGQGSFAVSVVTAGLCDQLADGTLGYAVKVASEKGNVEPVIVRATDRVGGGGLQDPEVLSEAHGFSLTRAPSTWISRALKAVISNPVEDKPLPTTFVKGSATAPSGNVCNVWSVLTFDNAGKDRIGVRALSGNRIGETAIQDFWALVPGNKGKLVDFYGHGTGKLKVCDQYGKCQPVNREGFTARAGEYIKFEEVSSLNVLNLGLQIYLRGEQTDTSA